mmetsp:Transcript_84549/g.165466  ORF Transcript_84549/g.165466 Transcript_84549/m.165466 type:complete len:256 (-) Transcript_84549:553-1320(-)
MGGPLGLRQVLQLPDERGPARLPGGDGLGHGPRQDVENVRRGWGRQRRHQGGPPGPGHVRFRLDIHPARPLDGPHLLRGLQDRRGQGRREGPVEDEGAGFPRALHRRLQVLPIGRRRRAQDRTLGEQGPRRRGPADHFHPCGPARPRDRVGSLEDPEMLPRHRRAQGDGQHEGQGGGHDDAASGPQGDEGRQENGEGGRGRGQERRRQQRCREDGARLQSHGRLRRRHSAGRGVRQRLDDDPRHQQVGGGFGAAD